STLLRDTNYFRADIDKFVISYLVQEKKSDELQRAVWHQLENQGGKHKEAPKEYIEKLEFDNYTAFEVDLINGLKLFSILRRGTWVEAFYYLKTINQNLDPDDKVNYINYVDKNTDCPTFTTSW
ncbi:MAG: hypothetical protein ACKO96_07750, partial [Flammeovirgaceae bacterium]